MALPFLSFLNRFRKRRIGSVPKRNRVVGAIFGHSHTQSATGDDHSFPGNLHGSGRLSGTHGFDGIFGGKNRTQGLIRQYRRMSFDPDVNAAIDEIVNEAIIINEDRSPVMLSIDHIKTLSRSTKNKILDEFDQVLGMLDFGSQGYDIFRKWYVDGHAYQWMLIDKKRPKDGLQAIVQLNATELKPIFPDGEMNSMATGSKNPNNARPIAYSYPNMWPEFNTELTKFMGVMIEEEQLIFDANVIAHVDSGLVDDNFNAPIGFLHTAIRPLNQLRSLEDASIVHIIARAPSRRVFFINVGSQSGAKAQETVNQHMEQFRNKVTYNAATGEVDSQSHNFMSILDDFWIARREGSTATEVTKLDGDATFTSIDEMALFRNKLYKALNIPVGRLDEANAFTFGRSSEITREEIKLGKFIDRLRSKFSELFMELLRVAVVSKNILTFDEWDVINKALYFNYTRDSQFIELKEAEILTNRLQTLEAANNHVGSYFSREWVMRKILRLNDKEITEMNDQIKAEQASNLVPDVNVQADPDSTMFDPNAPEEPAAPVFGQQSDKTDNPEQPEDENANVDGDDTTDESSSPDLAKIFKTYQSKFPVTRNRIAPAPEPQSNNNDSDSEQRNLLTGLTDPTA